jgi:hypothetical protein
MCTLIFVPIIVLCGLDHRSITNYLVPPAAAGGKHHQQASSVGRGSARANPIAGGGGASKLHRQRISPQLRRLRTPWASFAGRVRAEWPLPVGS